MPAPKNRKVAIVGSRSVGRSNSRCFPKVELGWGLAAFVVTVVCVEMNHPTVYDVLFADGGSPDV